MSRKQSRAERMFDEFTLAVHTALEAGCDVYEMRQALDDLVDEHDARGDRSTE